MLGTFVLSSLLALPVAPQDAIPDAPSWAERAWKLATLILGTEDEDSRYYLQIGGIRTGAGFSLGPGVRFRNLAGGRLEAEARAVMSYRKYLLLEGSLAVPRTGPEWLKAGLFARRQYFPEEDFFGLGPASLERDRVSYSYDENAAGLFATATPRSSLTLDARVSYGHPDLGRGHDPEFPSIEALFDDSSAPGLARQPDFIVAVASADLNLASPPGNPRDGGRYLVSVSRFDGRGSGACDFTRLDVDLRQYVPVVSDRHVLVFRAVTELARAGEGAEVPFYYQPTLGGSSSLRGFRDFRFRDRNLFLLQGEYRLEVARFVQATMFYDAGKVAPRASALGFRRIESDYGAGVRVGTWNRVFARLEAAFGGRDGTRWYLKFSSRF